MAASESPSPRRSRMDRKVRSEAASLVKEVRRALRRHSERMPTSVRDQLQLSADVLTKAREDDDGSAMRHELVVLDDLADEHLAFARKSTAREYAESIGIAVLIALMLRAFVVEAFKIPSGSMIPTMEIGDHIFVNKFIYGVRIPGTDSKLFAIRSPQRGEVIVFKNPCEPERDFIKRVVATGGDTVEVRCNILYVNGEPVKEGAKPHDHTYWDLTDQRHADCDPIQPGKKTWVKCTASDYLESMGGYDYHTLYDLSRPQLAADRAAGRYPRSYWAYEAAEADRHELHFNDTDADFPELPRSSADAVPPRTDGPAIEPVGEERLAAVHRVLKGESPTEVAADLSRRFEGEDWCPDAGSCVSDDDVKAWFPDPVGCGFADGEGPFDRKYNARQSLRIPEHLDSGPCSPKLQYVVPDGYVFAMGDNRNRSSDSREWGPVPLEYIKGKALFIWWSTKPARAGGYHWHRVGKMVH